jgi:hypothetical protein
MSKEQIISIWLKGIFPDSEDNDGIIATSQEDDGVMILELSNVNRQRTWGGTSNISREKLAQALQNASPENTVNLNRSTANQVLPFDPHANVTIDYDKVNLLSKSQKKLTIRIPMNLVGYDFLSKIDPVLKSASTASNQQVCLVPGK